MPEKLKASSVADAQKFIGRRVRIDEGSEWFDRQGDFGVGTVDSVNATGWAQVKFDSGHQNNYQVGINGKCDLRFTTDTHMPEKLKASSVADAQKFIGRRVRIDEGSEWFDRQGDWGVGTVIFISSSGRAIVNFDSGHQNNYQVGINEKCDLRFTAVKPGSVFKTEEERKEFRTEYYKGEPISPSKGVTEENMYQFLQKLTTNIRRMLNANDQTLYRAGYLNGDLEMTERGKQALLGVLLHQEEVKTALVEEAKTFIDEAEKEEKKAARKS